MRGRLTLVVPAVVISAALVVDAAITHNRRTNPIDGAEMVLIPRGTFEMGRENAQPLEQPVHTQLLEGFWMYTKEVTNAQYRKFVQANPRWAPGKVPEDLADKGYLRHWTIASQHASSANEHPVVHVSWHAASAYAQWAGGNLPNEAEWEYAAKGGKNFAHGTATGEINESLANRGPGGTKPTGSYRPNPFGLFDMTGNVREWCTNLLRPYPYIPNDGREQPDAPGSRVVRGGSWANTLYFSHTSSRLNDDPDQCDRDLGFRVAMPGPIH